MKFGVRGVQCAVSTTPTPTPTTVTVTTNNGWNVSLQPQNPASTVRNVAVKCCTYGENADSSSKMLQRAWQMNRTCCNLLQIPWKIQVQSWMMCTTILTSQCPNPGMQHFELYSMVSVLGTQSNSKDSRSLPLGCI